MQSDGSESESESGTSLVQSPLHCHLYNTTSQAVSVLSHRSPVTSVPPLYVLNTAVLAKPGAVDQLTVDL